MSFRHVSHAVMKPNHCAVFPQLGSSHPKGFLDTGKELPWESHVYVSVEAVEQMARQQGFVSREEHQRLGEAFDEAQGQVELLRRELANLQDKFDAIDVLASADFRARKKPGKKPREKAAA